MSVKIRLSRVGKNKKPQYRIVVAQTSSPRDGKFIAIVGEYHPLLKDDNPGRVKLNIEQIKYWLSVGAQPTDRVALFLQRAGVIEKKAA